MRLRGQGTGNTPPAQPPRVGAGRRCRRPPAARRSSAPRAPRAASREMPRAPRPAARSPARACNRGASPPCEAAAWDVNRARWIKGASDRSNARPPVSPGKGVGANRAVGGGGLVAGANHRAGTSGRDGGRGANDGEPLEPSDLPLSRGDSEPAPASLPQTSPPAITRLSMANDSAIGGALTDSRVQRGNEKGGASCCDLFTNSSPRRAKKDRPACEVLRFLVRVFHRFASVPGGKLGRRRSKSHGASS